MAIDNKQPGDITYAFEVNAIIKALRTLFAAVSDVASQGWDNIGSAPVAATVNVPAKARFIVIAMSTNHSSGNLANFKFDMFLAKTGKTSSTFETGVPMNAASNSNHFRATVTASWSGTTLTLSASTDSGNITMSGTAYFFS